MATTLTSEQETVARSKLVSMNRTPGEVLSFLTALSSWDKIVEKRAAFWGWVAVIAGLIGFPGGIIWLGVKKQHPERGISLLVITLVLVIVLARVWSKWKKQDLSDNFRVGAMPFLSVLREDMDPKEVMQVKLDLRGPIIDEKKKSESDAYKSGVYYSVIDRVYEDPWFAGSATLADATDVSWNVTEYAYERERRKRNPRGKIKIKKKVKKRTTAVVTLNFASKDYALAEQTDGVKQKKKAITLKGAEKTDGTAATPAFDLLVALMSDAYRRVSVEKSA
jgi:hypothetical protein